MYNRSVENELTMYYNFVPLLFFRIALGTYAPYYVCTALTRVCKGQIFNGIVNKMSDWRVSGITDDQVKDISAQLATELRLLILCTV
jgi:hypothetical protein